MNTNQQNRFEIMKALEKDFPDRLLEDLIDVARYVEGDGTPASKFAHEFLKAGVSGPRKWTNLDAIPCTVKAITDRDGDRAEPQTFQGKRKWVFTDASFHGLPVSPNDGPFTEVPSAPRTWTNLDAIPSNVKAITDKDGDRAEPQTLRGKRAWVFTDAPFHGMGVSPDDGPFTEVPENE